MDRLKVYACKRIKLSDIAHMERAVKGKVYPPGTVYIQVSACKRVGTPGTLWKVLPEESSIESKYAVLHAKTKIHPGYLLIALERTAPAFMHKYVGSNINIQMDAFDFYTLDYHEDEAVQEEIAKRAFQAETAIMAEEETVQNLKELKRFMLAKMMI